MCRVGRSTLHTRHSVELCNVCCRYAWAHIWACPPCEGDDYIFHCHPQEQKIPKPKRLQDWYRKMLDKAQLERVIFDYKVCIAIADYCIAIADYCIAIADYCITIADYCIVGWNCNSTCLNLSISLCLSIVLLLDLKEKWCGQFQ